MIFRDELQADIVKIIVLGDSKVGKSSFIERYVDNRFTDNYTSTIGFDYRRKTLNEHGGKPVNLTLQLWDIGGQERFRLLTRSFYRYARGCMIMFDLADPDSFENVKKWKKAVDDNLTIPCFLVANKLDLSPRKVTYPQIERLCQDSSFIQWTETSVKDGINVSEAVTYLLDVILNKSPDVYTPTEYEVVDVVQLADFENKPKRKRCTACK